MSQAKHRHVPKYQHFKPRNLAKVRLDGKDIYLGKYDSPESHKEYRRLIAQWLLTRNVQPTEPDDLAVCELMASYLKFAQGYYIKDGKVTSEFACILAAMKPLRFLYGDSPVANFGPKALKAVREQMIREGVCRSTVNSQVKRLQRMFKWGASEELVSPTVYQAVATVSGLRKGRTEAKERPPVLPVSDATIDQTLPHLPDVVADMVRLQRFSGARPGEVIKLRPCEIDPSGEVWEYHPGSHKTEHHDKQRIIFFGPQAQQLLTPYLDRPERDFCFSPAGK